MHIQKERERERRMKRESKKVSRAGEQVSKHRTHR